MQGQHPYLEKSNRLMTIQNQQDPREEGISLGNTQGEESGRRENADLWQS